MLSPNEGRDWMKIMYGGRIVIGGFLQDVERAPCMRLNRILSPRHVGF
jgi:hypothetical protein